MNVVKLNLLSGVVRLSAARGEEPRDGHDLRRRDSRDGTDGGDAKTDTRNRVGTKELKSAGLCALVTLTTLHAFKYQTDGVEEIVEYLGYASRDGVLIDGGTVEWDFRLAVPDLPGAFIGVAMVVWDGYGSANNSVAWRTGLQRTAGTIELLDVPGSLGPAAGEDGVDHATKFAVGGQEGQVKVFTWAAVSDVKPLIALTTTRDVVTIPDPSDVGLGAILPQGTQLVWYVNTLFGQDVDDATTDIRTARGVLGPLFDLGGVMNGPGEGVQVEGEVFVFGQP